MVQICVFRMNSHADITHFQAFALDYENNIAKVVCYGTHVVVMRDERLDGWPAGAGG